MKEYYKNFKPYFNEEEYDKIQALIPKFKEHGLILKYAAGPFVGDDDPKDFFSVSTVGMKYEVNGERFGSFCAMNNNDILNNAESIINECKKRLMKGYGEKVITLSTGLKELRDEHIYYFPAEHDGPMERSPIVLMIWPDYGHESRFPFIIPITDENESKIIDKLRSMYYKRLEELKKDTKKG